MPTLNAIDNLETFASKESGSVTRRFGGVTESLSATANQAGLSERVTEARDASSRAFSTAEGALSRRQRGLGLQLSDRQSKSQGRRLGLARAIAQDDRGESVRRGFLTRKRAVEGASGSLEDGLFGTELAGMTQLANAEGQKQTRERNEAAQKKANKNSLIGSIIGTGISLLALSSEDAKDKRGKPKGLLEKLRSVRVDRWNYKGETRLHVGPYAEEFNDTFEVGHGHRGLIDLVDGLGVALGAIKELDARTRVSHAT